MCRIRILLFFLIHLELKQAPRKPHPIQEQNGESLYLFSDRKQLKKTIPFGAAHTYMAYKREYPLPSSWP